MPELDLTASHELIEGSSLILRPVTHDDVEDYYLLTRTAKALSPIPFTVMQNRDMAWLALSRFFSKSSHHKAYVAMDRRGRLQGVIFITIDSIDRKTILSWLFKPVIDQAANALELLVSFMKDDCSRRIEVAIQPGEASAIELVLSLGFEKEASLRSYIFRNGAYHDVWLFTRLAP